MRAETHGFVVEGSETCGKRAPKGSQTCTRTPSQVYWRCIVTIQSCSDGSDYGDDTVDIHWIISNFHRYLEPWAFTQRTSKNQHLKRLIFIKLPFFVYIYSTNGPKEGHTFICKKQTWRATRNCRSKLTWHGDEGHFVWLFAFLITCSKQIHNFRQFQLKCDSPASRKQQQQWHSMESYDPNISAVSQFSVGQELPASADPRGRWYG